MKGNDEERLTANQLKALPLFATNTSILEISRQAKVTSKTIYEWLKRESFKSAVEKIRNETFSEAMQLLKSSAGESIKTLLKLLSSEDERIKLSAAKELINFSFRSKETLELEERISNLEQVANAKS